MGTIEILWTVAGVVVPLLLGTAWAMVGLAPPEFWIARGCVGLAAFIFGAISLIWLSTSEWANPARIIVGVVLGAAAFITFSEAIRWINARESFVVSQAVTAAAADQTIAVLLPPQERLLALLADYQRQFAANKLIVGRGGTLHFDNDPKRGEGINLVHDLYGQDGQVNAARFVELMEGMPPEYLRFFIEIRLGSPFVVSVTESGLKYLKKQGH